MADDDSGGFPFDEGATVTVTVREHRTSGPIVATFTAECDEIRERPDPMAPVARFDLPWGTMNTVTIQPYQGEFEVETPADADTDSEDGDGDE